MLYASLVARVDAVLKLVTGDTRTRELVENFELMDISEDLWEEMLKTRDMDDAIGIYTLWVKNLEPIEIRLTAADHYLGDPEGPVDGSLFSITTLQEAHLGHLNDWLREHRGWFLEIKTEATEAMLNY
jgi:hypothetical protein